MSNGRLDFAGKRSVMMDAAGGLYALKKTLRADIGFFEKDFMFKAGLEGTRESLSSLTDVTYPNDPNETIQKMLELYSLRGYGDFKVDKFDLNTKVVEIASTNAIEAWAFQENHSLQREPICSYSSGMLSCICRMAFREASVQDSDIFAVEMDCMAEGKKECRFVVGPVQELNKRFPEFERPDSAIAEHELKLNEEILVKNLELQGLNLSLERQIRKRTEDLWRSEDNYKSLMAISPDPIVIMTSGGRINSLNPAGLRLLGYETIEDALNIKASAIMADKDEAWDKITWLLEKEGTIHDLEMEFTKRDGSGFTGQLTARFADLLPGKCIEAVIKDISEKKMMEQQVKEARSESEFLNDLLSHDIMNYTFSALHFLNKLLKSPKIMDDDRKDLSLITKEIQGAFELSSSVRDLSRIKTIGDEEEAIKDVSLVIAEAIEDAKRMFSDKKVVVNFNRSSEPHYVKCNNLATSMFTNLLTNAIKYDLHNEVVVDITIDNVVEKGQTCWQIGISDNGKGIPDDEKERVLERFHRIDMSVSGTGLGLYVVRFIANASGGRVWAENRVEGDHTKGTTMVVLLQKPDEKQIAKMTKKPTGPG
ncbi:MAG: PAS domain S-box protein [Candidatus Thermoplasmatota archaeon]|nr:PAS domain S-box protein [Candidatus Thermoplasmatota archaeon]